MSSLVGAPMVNTIPNRGLGRYLGLGLPLIPPSVPYLARPPFIPHSFYISASKAGRPQGPLGLLKAKFSKGRRPALWSPLVSPDGWIIPPEGFASLMILCPASLGVP